MTSPPTDAERWTRAQFAEWWRRDGCARFKATTGMRRDLEPAVTHATDAAFQEGVRLERERLTAVVHAALKSARSDFDVRDNVTAALARFTLPPGRDRTQLEFEQGLRS